MDRRIGLDSDGRNGPRNDASMDLMLTGRVAVITGPAKGMGAAITMASVSYTHLTLPTKA